jgi:hypothetical protein
MADLPKEVIIGKKKPSVLELGQFWQSEGLTYCFKHDCGSCRYEASCERELVWKKVGPGINMRRAFRARPGFRLAAIDYKGIELRVAGQLSGERFFIDAFVRGDDLHTNMAKVAFKTETPTKEQRDKAKCANFGNLFLGSAATLSRQSDLDIAEATYIWTQWWAALPIYKKWTDSQLLYAMERKCVVTKFGRVRRLDFLIAQAQKEMLTGKKDGKGKSGQGFIHRTSVNSPVQGTAADLMKIAMVRLQDWIDKEGLGEEIKLLLTVHDELVLEIRDDEHFVSRAYEVSRKMCPTNLGWEVPIETDIEVGYNWAELCDIKTLGEDKRTGVGAVATAIAAPVAKKSEKAILSVNCSLSELNLLKLKSAIRVASNVNGVVKVPLRLKIVGNVYHAATDVKVCESTLLRETAEIPGVELETV